ncbi:unnamed protein product [Oppiella nova]|uniref:Uncharacterized protein n=1 Tax=Oppiella nova TaxID=334625 RepID=A0A7R9MAA1_9ACAR|nr:unnamed protein product [Oppiella nova]CAG2173601.1 unnamed protein product [Oppiella nova]
MDLYKTLFATIILIVLINGSCSLEKGCRMNVLDAKFKNVVNVVGSLDYKYPNNEKEMETYCKQMREYVTDSRNYMKKCAKDIAKTILSVTLHSVEKMTVKSSCRLQTEKKRFLSFSKCGNAGHKEIVKCWQNNIKRITAINNNSTKTKNQEYIEQYIEKGMLDPMNVFCSEYDDSDKCDKILKQLPKIDSIKLKYTTLFPAVIEMFESL